jgi:hypothetical protein
MQSTEATLFEGDGRPMIKYEFIQRIVRSRNILSLYEPRSSSASAMMRLR